MNPQVIQLYNKGLECAKQGQLSQACAFFKEVVQLEPNDLHAWNALGKTHLHLGMLNEAKRCWRGVLTLDKNDPTAKQCLRTIQRAEWSTLLGRLAVMLVVLVGISLGLRTIWIFGLHEKVNQVIQGTTSLQRQTAEARLGTTLSGDLNALQADIALPEGSAASEAVAQTPSQTDARGDEAGLPAPPPAESTQRSRRPVLRSASGIKPLYEHSLTLCRDGNPEEAILGFQAILDAGFPSSLLDNAQFWLGECYLAQKQYAEALQAFENVASLPDGNKAFDAQKQIAKLKLKRLIR